MRVSRITLFVLVLGMTISLLPVNAQETAKACDKDTVNLAIAEVAKSAQDAQAATDANAAIEILAETSAKIASLQAECNGLSFTGKTPTVLGPIDFAAGVYRVVAKSSGHLTAIGTTLDGECGQGSGALLSDAIFIGVESDAQTVFTSNGCSALIEVKDDNWAIQFQKIK